VIRGLFVICVEGLICAVRACDIKDNELQRAPQKIPSTHKLAYKEMISLIKNRVVSHWGEKNSA
jgi:hypothetical protein